MIDIPKKRILEAKKISAEVLRLRKKKHDLEIEIKYTDKLLRISRTIIEIERLINALKLLDPLPEVLQFNAIKIYTKANEDIDELKNHSIESIAAACLISACEKALVDISFSDISRHSPERGCIIGNTHCLIE